MQIEAKLEEKGLVLPEEIKPHPDPRILNAKYATGLPINDRLMAAF